MIGKEKASVAITFRSIHKMTGLFLSEEIVMVGLRIQRARKVFTVGINFLLANSWYNRRVLLLNRVVLKLTTAWA